MAAAGGALLRVLGGAAVRGAAVEGAGAAEGASAGRMAQFAQGMTSHKSDGGGDKKEAKPYNFLATM